MYVNCKVLFQSCEKWRWRYEMLYSSTLLQVHIYHHFIIFGGIFLEFSLSQICYIAALCCRSTSTTTSSTTHSEWSEENSKTTRWDQTTKFETFFASEDQQNFALDVWEVFCVGRSNIESFPRWWSTVPFSRVWSTTKQHQLSTR